MTKYILKESELRSIIGNIVSEELNTAVNEGLLGTLKNVAGTAAKVAITPFTAAGDAFTKTSNFLAGNSPTGGSSRSTSNSKAKTASEKQRERLTASKSVGYEYGKPEVIPSWGNRLKLDSKREITAPENSQLEWGSFGRHYHDEGDKMWNRVLLNKESTIIRLSRGDQKKTERLQRKYKKILVGWLKDRDVAYETYIKSNNRI